MRLQAHGGVRVAAPGRLRGGLGLDAGDGSVPARLGEVRNGGVRNETPLRTNMERRWTWPWQACKKDFEKI